MIATGVRTVATEKLFSQGAMSQTTNPLDVGIDGKGFLQIQMPDGTLAYTRDGELQVDSQGQLVTSSGYSVQPTVVIPADAQSITIATDGTVSVRQPGSSSTTQVGNLQLVDFVSPAGLQTVGSNLYVADRGEPPSARTLYPTMRSSNHCLRVPEKAFVVLLITETSGMCRNEYSPGRDRNRLRNPSCDTGFS